MIGRLRGKLVGDDVDGTVLLDVSGVGYELTVPLGALGRARDDQEGALTLVVHTHVREDAILLFGFASEAERQVFRMLLTLPGVGPKLAIAILSSLPPRELAAAVAEGDLKRLGRIPGVGRKTAERLVLELKEKLPNADSVATPRRSVTRGDDRERLLGALTNMGYKPAEAERGIKGLEERIGVEPISDLLRTALAALTK